jgi:hypothetical protein
MPFDLPDIRLTPDVMRRVQGRLLGIFGGVRAQGLDPSAPRVIRRHNDPLFCTAKSERKKLRTQSVKIPHERVRRVVGRAQDREEDEDTGGVLEQSREQVLQEEEEEVEGVGVEEGKDEGEEREGGGFDDNDELTSSEKLEIQNDILRRLMSRKRREKNLEIENVNMTKKRRRQLKREKVCVQLSKHDGDESDNESGGDEEEERERVLKKGRRRNYNEIVHDKRKRMVALQKKKMKQKQRKEKENILEEK